MTGNSPLLPRKPDDDWPLLPGERRVRFGCGVIAGVALALSYMLGGGHSAGVTILVCLASAIVVGVAAALFGDRFWYWLMNITPWTR
jgi:hypothetical protein